MPSRPTLTAAALVAGLLALTGCSGDSPDAVAESAPATTAPASGGAPAAPAAAGTVLKGFVGTDDDPEAFEIGLTDADGNPVTSVPAGTYELQVDDPSSIHNFAISGDGVNEATSVPKREQVTYTVTLKPGTYTFVCDPHPSMQGTLTVT